VTKIEIRVTDASGNLTQDTLVITVIPFPNKSFVNIPPDQVLTGCPQVASWTTPTVQGFCEPPVITTDSISGSVFPVGVSVVTFTATEPNGATFTATFSITITESEKPTITCPNSVLVSSAGVELSGPSNTIISIASSGTGCQEVDMELKLPTATDNCTDAVTITQTGGPSVNGIFPIGTHTLTFEAKDNAGNTSACSYLVEVQPFDVLTPQVTPNPGCDGSTVTISVPAFPGATYTWTGPQQSYPNEPVITILSLGTGNAGQYTVTAKLNGCTAIGDTVNVVLVQKPDAILDSGLTISLGETLDSIPVLANDIFSVANDIQVSQVSPLDGLTLNDDGTFTYVAGNNGGSVSFLYEICSKACPDLCDMAEVTINIRDKECAFVPNIFTPNGDMTNDVLVIPCLGTNAVDNPYPNNTIMIYNQWGTKVFEAKGYANEAGKAWDGTLNNDGSNKLPDGVYYYIFKPDANAATLKGFVHIYR
jgi:gliding motility-associated-like protein